MNVYIYAADIYCEDCGLAIRESISNDGREGVQEDGWSPADPENESSYDSDEYPKGPYLDGGGEANLPLHCGAGSDCLHAIVLSDGTPIGAWLENELTSDGVDYVLEAIQEGKEVAELWREFYCDYDLIPRKGKCVCENPGVVCSGVPGILAAMEDGKVIPGAAVERCDRCKRFPDDKAARAKMRSLGFLPFDSVGFIMAYEGGELTEREIIEGFQDLIDTGLCWKLQGAYGRYAAALIKRGRCRDTHNYLKVAQ